MRSARPFTHEVPVLARADRLAERASGCEQGRHVERAAQKVAFGPHVAGQHVVCQLRGRRHPVLEDHHEVLVHEPFDYALLPRITHHRVVGDGEEGLHGVGPFPAHGREQGLRIAGARFAQNVGLVGNARALVRLVVKVGCTEAQDGALVPPQLLTALFGREHAVAGQLGGSLRSQRRAEHRFALVEEAADCAQDALELDERGGVRLHVGHHAPGDDGSLRAGVDACRLAYEVGGDAARFGSALGRPRAHALAQFVEACAALLHEIVVVQPFLDDDVHPRQHERRIGAVADAQVVVGQLGRFRFARVDFDELCAACQRRLQLQVFARPALGVAVLSEVHDAVGLVPVGKREPAVHRAVDLCGVAHAQLHGGRVVDGSQAVHEAPRDAADSGVEWHFRHSERLGPVCVHHRLQALRDFVKRLVPRDFLPCTAAALAHAAQRVRHAAFVQAVLVDLVRLRADGRHCRVGGQDVHRAVVAYFRLDRASAVAEHAGRVSRLHGILASSSLSPSYVCVRFAQLGKS